MAVDVYETLPSISLAAPAPALPGVCVGGFNSRYILRGSPAQQTGSQHLYVVLLPLPHPELHVELMGRPPDIGGGLPQGAVLDSLGGITLPFP